MNFLFNINVCRVCMENNQNGNLWTDKSLLEKFQFTTRLSIIQEDNLPKTICSRCTTRLEVSYNFIKTAHDSEKNLKLFLAKINSEFKEVAQGNKSNKKSLEEQNTAEDDLILSLMGDENNENTFTNAEEIEDCPKSISNEINPKNITEFKYETQNNSNEIQKSKEDNFVKCEKAETVYLIHNNNMGYNINMEIPNDGDEVVIEKDRYVEEFPEENNYTTMDMIESNEESEIPSQSTELAMENCDGNNDYETLVNSQEDTIQYHSIYVDESSIEATNDNYVNNLHDENKISDNSPVETVTKSLRIESSGHRFYCNKCNRDFSTKTNLNRHMQSHEGNRPFSCTECKKSFTQKSTLKQHMYTHTGERPYVCEVCNRGFTQCKSLVFHMRRHTGEKPFHCEYCLITFRQKDALRLHILKHHVVIERAMNGTEIYTCIICQKKFNTKPEFKTHMKVHTATAEIDNIVTFMGEETESSLNKRGRKSYNNGSDLLMPIDSEYANAAVVNVSASSAAEPSRAKKFQCRKCFKCFALKKSLVHHMRVHNIKKDNEMAECFDCELKFSSVEVYQEHLSECHQYACPELDFNHALEQQEQQE